MRSTNEPLSQNAPLAVRANRGDAARDRTMKLPHAGAKKCARVLQESFQKEEKRNQSLWPDAVDSRRETKQADTMASRSVCPVQSLEY